MVLNLLDTDKIFFRQWPERQTRIRKPIGRESHAAFLSLGPHNEDRRRILVWRVPKNNPIAPGEVVQVPFLLFADETVNDDDETLLPILHEIMMNAKKKG